MPPLELAVLGERLLARVTPCAGRTSGRPGALKKGLTEEALAEKIQVNSNTVERRVAQDRRNR